MKKMMLHVLAVGVIAGVLAGVGVYAYQREDGFTPSADSPEIQENHVVFEDEEKEEPEVKKSTGESDIWEKNRQSKEKLDRMPDSSALFSRTRTSVKDSTPDR